MEEEARRPNGWCNVILLGIIALYLYSPLVPLLTQMYKWVLVTEQEVGVVGESRGSPNRDAFTFFVCSRS